MCCKNKNDVPNKVIKKWLDLNPGYIVKLYDDDECIDFLNKEYSLEYGKIFEELPYGPIKADFWRICILNKYGGVYSDIDIEPLEPLNKILENNNEITFCSCMNFTKNNIFQAFIYSTPNNPILKKCIEIMIKKKPFFFEKNIKNTKKYDNKLYWKLSGCNDMYYVIKKFVGKNISGNNIYSVDNQIIKLLDEYIPKGYKSVRKCLVRYHDKNMIKSRYDDYNMKEHKFN
jgi:hypothetical protein